MDCKQIPECPNTRDAFLRLQVPEVRFPYHRRGSVNVELWQSRTQQRLHIPPESAFPQPCIKFRMASPIPSRLAVATRIAYAGRHSRLVAPQRTACARTFRACSRPAAIHIDVSVFE